MLSQAVNPDNGPLYIDTTVPRIDIKINPDTLSWIYANPTSDREFHAVFVFNNGTVRDTVNNIGFRLRGNTSRFSQKKSFNISFNTYTVGGKYYGVEKLNLNGEHNDPSIMRSKLMWDILRKWGLPAPRANHVRVYINNQYYGVYINVEHIDEEFAESRFGNKDGNLYKCLYPADLTYLGDNQDNYKFNSGDRRAYDLKTNEARDDYSDLAAFIKTLNNTSDQSLVCDLDSIFNLYDLIKIMAADIFCGDWDGYIFNKNNFFLYHNTATGKFEYIPYDLDNTFGIDWFQIDWATRNIYSWQPGGSEKRPLYDRLLNNTELRNQFTHFARQLISSTIDLDSLEQSVEQRRNMIAPYVEADPYYPLDYGYDYNEFQLSYTAALGAHVKYGLYPYLNLRKQSMLQQLENTTMTPVITHIRYRWENEKTITISAAAESDFNPLALILLYSFGDAAVQQSSMNYYGNGSYSLTLENIAEETEVHFQIMATDGNNNIKILPCNPALIKPLPDAYAELYINEVMADNFFVIADEYGHYSDWIEIYNGDDSEVNLGNFYLTDEINSPDKWRLPEVILPPGGFELFWADGNSDAGDHHAGFKLDKSGETIGLFSSNLIAVDTLKFGLQSRDISFGRITDGAARLVYFHTPTPDAPNVFSDSDRKLIVYPNPATGNSVRLDQKVNCTIYNAAGLIIWSGNDVDEIDISHYPSGLYIVLTDTGLKAKFVVIRSR